MSLRSATVLLAAAAAVPLAGCHTSGCRDGDQICIALTEAPPTTESTGEPDETTTIHHPTTGPGETETTGPEETSGTTVLPPGECGDGEHNAGEDCDDGNDVDNDACRNDCTAAQCGDGVVNAAVEECDDGNDSNMDSCVVGCKFATCGDGYVRQGAEQCDAGPDNTDGEYGGCSTKCQLGPRCGDGAINGPESCDDGNRDDNDGCLSACIEAQSCLHILQNVPDAPTGPYRIWPAALNGDVDVTVWCDMDTDGGGYTFLKVDTEYLGQSDKGAQKAEQICQSYGMHLIVPRTPDHVKSMYAVATTETTTPVGGGDIGSGVDYVAILAIYPAALGATCDGGPLNSEMCPGYRAWDMQTYWVTDVPVPGEPDPSNCLGCSMFYKWNPDGTLKSYTAFGAGEGAGSYRFLCDVADKLPG